MTFCSGVASRPSLMEVASLERIETQASRLSIAGRQLLMEVASLERIETID